MISLDKGIIMEISQAHARSAYSIVDPLYMTGDLSTELNRNYPWIYGECEMECFLLKKMRQDTVKAKLRVGYPGEFKVPDERVWFKARISGINQLRFRACGSVNAIINNRIVYQSAHCEDIHAFSIEEDRVEIIFDLHAPNEVPCLSLEDHLDTQWEWAAYAKVPNWAPVEIKYSLHPNITPHREEPAAYELKPVGESNGIYDFGKEIFGTISIKATSKPTIFVGESGAEARSQDANGFEQSTIMEAAGEGYWISSNQLAFRYVVCNNASIDDISCHIPCTDICYRGAFACSDETLTKIWSSSAYSLRLCMENFMLDGVKRDRLPWVGDLAMSMLVNAYAFGDGAIIKQTLSVLGRAGISKSHLNGIFDYSLWWIISHDLYQLYFADMSYLHKEWPRIQQMLTDLQQRCDEMGMLKVREDEWLFIDWVEMEKVTALQILWQWAQQSAANLAERIGETETASFWRQSSRKLEKALYRTAWDDKQKLWYGTPNAQNSSFSRHALFFSVVSGLISNDDYSSVLPSLLGNDLTAVGTPYMAGFEYMALSMLGAVPQMLQRTKAYWGGMLKRGATTFWEAYNADEEGDDAYRFYNRPFGKSLCHAWSAGPAAFLPQGILGLKPLEDGWKRFTLSPCLDELSWITVTIPSPYGNISITIDDNVLYLQLPAEVTAEHNGSELKGNYRTLL